MACIRSNPQNFLSDLSPGAQARILLQRNFGVDQVNVHPARRQGILETKRH